jgi:signal transduction histidine kinase
VPVAEILEAIVTPYQVAGGAIVTSLEVERGLPPVAADRTLVARALTNVIENGRQAMPSGGRVVVRASREDAEWVRITITDSGAGMDEVAKARAFEPYFSTKTAGSGLGLPNAKRNVELCGGSLTLESARGRGTTVTVRLRVAA